MHEIGHRVGHHHGPFGGPHGRWERAWFGGPPWPGSRRARRGDVRTALLSLLAERPMHGYDLMRELAERSGGAWHPSPGSVYPTLQMLEDEGLVTGEEQEGKRVFSITDAGRAEVEARKERAGYAAPWHSPEGHEAIDRLRQTGFQLAAATMQVARAGTVAQMERATEILAKARGELYAMLAEG